MPQVCDFTLLHLQRVVPARSSSAVCPWTVPPSGTLGWPAPDHLPSAWLQCCRAAGAGCFPGPPVPLSLPPLLTLPPPAAAITWPPPDPALRGAIPRSWLPAERRGGGACGRSYPFPRDWGQGECAPPPPSTPRSTTPSPPGSHASQRTSFLDRVSCDVPNVNPVMDPAIPKPTFDILKYLFTIHTPALYCWPQQIKEGGQW